GPEQGELLARGLGHDFAAHEIGISLVDTLEVPRRLEPVDQNPDRNARRAAVAGGSVGDRLAPAEAGMRERLAKGLGEGTGETGEHFALNAAWQVRAGPSGRKEELRNACVVLLGHE